MIQTLIIDDEKSGRETLHFLLKKHFSDRIQVIAMAENLKEGVEIIESNNPQLVFLDIEMPGESGLEILKKTSKRNFEIIITTAHRQYGIEAIKLGVADYLLKPVDTDELETTIQKIETKINSKKGESSIQLLLNQLEELNSTSAKLPLLVQNNKTIFVELKNIIRCEAEGNYTKFWFTDGKTELISKLLKEVEQQINSKRFFRAHKSHLINIDQIKSYSKSDDHIMMNNGNIIPLSRNEKPEFLKMMNI